MGRRTRLPSPCTSRRNQTRDSMPSITRLPTGKGRHGAWTAGQDGTKPSFDTPSSGIQPQIHLRYHLHVERYMMRPKQCSTPASKSPSTWRPIHCENVPKACFPVKLPGYVPSPSVALFTRSGTQRITFPARSEKLALFRQQAPNLRRVIVHRPPKHPRMPSGIVALPPARAFLLTIFVPFKGRAAACDAAWHCG